MNMNYEQGWQKVRRQLQQQMAWERQAKRVGAILCALALAGIVGMVMFSLAGCATTAISAKPVATSEIRMPAAISGLIQVGQMGLDCENEVVALKSILQGTFKENGSVPPSLVKIRVLSGSSLCGVGQGIADPFGTPELGAWHTARAEVSLYWSGLTESEFARVQEVFSWIKAGPVPPLLPPDTKILSQKQ